jgi:uncharacterized DUF497 family protein
VDFCHAQPSSRSSFLASAEAWLVTDAIVIGRSRLVIYTGVPYVFGMWIGGDAAKDERNQKGRGLPFLLIVPLLENLLGEYEDDRQDYGEARITAFGLVAGRLMVAVYTLRQQAGTEVVWVISLRKANTREQRKWL